MLSKAAKNELVREFNDVFKANPSVMVVEYKGLTVKELETLRANLKKADAQLKVVKNTLLRIAAKDTQIEQINDLFDGPTAVAICEKDATADLTRPSKQRLLSGEKFIQLSGEDGTALGFNAHGGVGCISVTANVAPRLCAEFQQATLTGDYRKAIKLQDRLMPLHVALFVETSPSPVKFAASLLGLCRPDVRLPLVGPGEGCKKQVREAMVHAGLLN